MRAAERCHVRDCPAREWQQQQLQQQQQQQQQQATVVGDGVGMPPNAAPMATNGANIVFRIPGDMRYLPVVLSAISRRFRNRKNNFMCKAHFLPEDLVLTGSVISLSKRAVPCFQVPRRTLKLVVRSGVSARHSEVACALLERARGAAFLLAAHDSSSDSDAPSSGDCCCGIPGGHAPAECESATLPMPPVCHPGLTQFAHISPSGIPESSLTLQQRLQLAGVNIGKTNPSSIVHTKRSSENFISRDDDIGGDSLVDYKRLKLSDSESPTSQGHGDVASDASAANSRADEVGDDGDEMEDESKDVEDPTEERVGLSLEGLGPHSDSGTAATAAAAYDL